MVSVGSGDFSYEVIPDWGALPDGFEWGLLGAVGVDVDDHVYVFSRSEHPLMVFERDGRHLYSFGGGVLRDGHGLCFDPDGNLLLVDRGPHVVMKFTTDGEQLMEIGARDQPSDTGATDEHRTVLRAAGPFNYPTDASCLPNGDFFVSDGDRNARVHKFSADGQLLFSWGSPGERPGEFNDPHSVWVHKQRVYVADRENHRIQTFSLDGEFVDAWTGFVQPADIYVDDNDIMYVAELSGRVSLVSLEGEVIARFGSPDDRVREPGKFVGPHGIWADSHGDFYVAEVFAGKRVQKFIRK
jgi:sugar lactone lactonase YvrE